MINSAFKKVKKVLEEKLLKDGGYYFNMRYIKEKNGIIINSASLREDDSEVYYKNTPEAVTLRDKILSILKDSIDSDIINVALFYEGGELSLSVM